MKRGKAAVKFCRSISLEGRICCCKRSACRKKYCECFRLNKLCTPACKCVGCCNKEMLFNDEAAGSSFMNIAIDTSIAATTSLESTIVKPAATSPPPVFVPPLRLKVAPKKEQKKKIVKEPITKQPPVLVQKPQVPITVNCISAEVVDAVVKCMLAQAQECVECHLNGWQTERMILDTFDGCLVDILRCMGIQASAEEISTTALLPVGARDSTLSGLPEHTAAEVVFTDLVENATTLDLVSLSATDDSNSGATLFVFDDESVKNMQINENSVAIVDANTDTTPSSSTSSNTTVTATENFKAAPHEATATAAVTNLQYIDAVDSGDFDFESFSKIYNENSDLLEFVEHERNLDDTFEFTQM